MNNSASKNRENLNPSVEQQNPVQNKEKQHDSREVREAADVGKAAYVEAMGLDESAETTGRVSEVLARGREDDTGGSLGARTTTGQAFDPAAIKARFLNNLPAEKEMRRQIEKEIRKEIDYLHSKAMKMLRKPGEVNYFEMSNILKKIRELKGILLSLLRASVDSMKTLWLRYVHGVM